MGIKELTKFIASCGKLTLYTNYKDTHVLVDMFQKLYRYCSRDDISSLQKGYIYNKHLRAVINCVNQLLKFGITPIFVFDGMSILTKTINKSNEEQNKIIKTINPNNQNIINNTNFSNKKTFKITQQQVKDCIALIHYMGLPYVRAPFEADSQCAVMTMKCTNSSNNVPIKTVVTDDTDVLVFGATSMLRMLPMKIISILKKLFVGFTQLNVDVNKCYNICDMCNIVDPNHCDMDYDKLQYQVNTIIKYDVNTINNFIDDFNINFAVEYDIDEILLFLNNKANNIKPIINRKFTHNNFIDMCILFGTDYLPRIKQMSVDEVFELFVLSDYDVTTYINTINEQHKSIPEDYLKTFDDVKEYYTCASVIDPRTIDISVLQPMDDKIYELLRNNCFQHSFIINNLRTYKNNFNCLLNTSK